MMGFDIAGITGLLERVSCPIHVQHDEAPWVTRSTGIDPDQLDQLLLPTFDTKAKKNVMAKGLPASPGAAVGQAVFSAEVGSVTGPVATIYGYHVLHVLDQRKPQPLSLADVRDAVDGRVLRELSQRRLDGFEAELLAGAAVEIGMSECSGTL